ncbi:MAG TPA: ABC transporter permease [Acidimicrobiales bacterium]|nr:ABC transporter permease [Acidimicrobiales bacterium]
MARARADLPAGPASEPHQFPSAPGAGAPSRTPFGADQPQRVVAAHVGTVARAREIWEARELLVFLVRKELKVRYKNSFLGFLWSFLNPAMVLLIYFVMFRYILKNGISDFAVYLMCGLLPWNLFNTALLSSSGTLVAHAGIVKKVAFPREILALTQVGVATCYFFFQSCILVLFLVGFQVMPDWRYLPVMLLALVCDVVFTAALALALSALNVYLRDIEHLIQVVLVALFFAEPIVYTWSNLGSRLGKHGLVWLYLLNPLTTIVISFQRFIFAHVPGALERSCPAHVTCGVLATYPEGFYFELLGIVLAVSLVLFYLASVLFRRVEGNFAEEL